MTRYASHFSPELHRPITTSSSRPVVQNANGRAVSDAQIAKRAYEKYERRGRFHGHDQEDWAAASRELVAEAFG